MEIMLNEHHQTATCVDPAAPLVLAALARADQEGAPPDPRQSDRESPQPVRVAEEMAMVDVLSHGRLEAASCAACPTRCCRPTATRCA